MTLAPERFEMQPVPPPAHDFIQIDDLIRFMRFTWRRKWCIAAGIAAGLLLGALYSASSVPVFEAKAKVLVMKREPRDSSSGGSRLYYFEDDVATHASVIASPWFIRDVIDQRGLASLPSLAESKDPVRAVVPRLTVMRETDDASRSPSSILDMSFRSSVAQDCGIVLNAVIERYQEFLEESARSVNEEAIKLITQRAEDARKELQEKEAEHQEFRKQAPLLWTGERGTTWYQERLANLELKRSELMIQRAEIRARLESLRRAVGEGAGGVAAADMVPDAFRREASASLEKELLPLLLQEKTLRKDYGPGHPDVLAIREQIQFTREFLAPSIAASKELPEAGESRVHRPAPDLVQSYMQSLQQDLANIEASEQALDERFEQEKSEAKEAAYYEFLDRQFRDDVARIGQYYESLVNQIQGVGLNKDLVGYNMRVIAPVGAPAQVAPRTFLIFTLAGFLGVVAGFGLGWTAESRDKSLRGPEEIRRLGMPVVGCIPLMATRRKALLHADSLDPPLDPILCTWHRPDSADADAYRAVRTALFVTIRGKQQKVIQITSPNAGDGKSTLAANLAISIAQSGKDVLLVDADLRSPRIHQLFGRPVEPGLTSVVHGDAEFPDAVQASGVDGLRLLPAGPLPPSPADLLVAPQLEELLGVARMQYDIVLVDTPALLLATDARVVAPCVDSVLLSIRVGKNGGPQLARAKEILEHLDVNLLGVVINATDRYAEFGGSRRYYDSSAATRPYRNGHSPEPTPPSGPTTARNKISIAD